MPEADYSFKPVDTVRTFGQILAHVADSNYFYCARSKGEAPPVPDGTLEKTATTKAAIVKALGESVAYCDGVYASLSAASAADMSSLCQPSVHWYRKLCSVTQSCRRCGQLAP